MIKTQIQLSGEPDRMDNYCAAVRACGGTPLPAYCPDPDLNCAGLLLCGGGDIDPAIFGQPNRGSNPPDVERDQAELALFYEFYKLGRPILGICRGMQIINVALGGTLIQDLPPEQRVFHGGSQEDLIHPVSCPEGSLLYGLYGSLFSVNSSHHQAVDIPGRGLRVSARAESGFPEAVELPGSPLLGVQFHPERMSFGRRRVDTVDGAPIFSWFLERCRNT